MSAAAPDARNIRWRISMRERPIGTVDENSRVVQAGGGRRHRRDEGPRGSQSGRDDWIRTSDPLTPSQVRYQAALHPVRAIWEFGNWGMWKSGQIPKFPKFPNFQ